MQKTNKELSLKQQQEISLDILKDVAFFCEQNNIKYFLACGTLLGAVRHKGFIPWDDDIDIMMPRNDYKRFLNEYKSGKYSLCKPSEGRFYYAKVFDRNTIKYEGDTDYRKYSPLGIDIDIFPLDGMKNDDLILNKIYKRECFLETLLRLSNQPIFNRKNPIKAINRIIPRIIGSKNLVKLIEKNAQAYDYDSSDYVVRMRWSPNGFTGILPKNVFEKEYMQFEDRNYCVPKGYDIWLTNFFGDDYMELPSKEKRKAHGCKCYMVNDDEN